MSGSPAYSHPARDRTGLKGENKTEQFRARIPALPLFGSASSPNNAVLTAKDAKYAKADQGVDSLDRHDIAVTGK